MSSPNPRPTYCNVMKSGPLRAKLFDWQFADYSVDERRGILFERIMFEREILELFEFDFDKKDKKCTRNISKESFLQELKSFKQLCTEGPCGCIMVTVSSHGIIGKKDNPAEQGGVELYEDYILTHPDPQKRDFSVDFVEERVSVKEIVEVFRDNQLKGVPKIFFIQSCRYKPNDQIHNGKEIDRGFAYVEVNHDDGKVIDVEVKDEDSSINRLPTLPKISIPDDRKIAYSPPHLEDTVIVFSTPFGYAAGFNTTRGGHVWDVLQETLKQQPEQVDLIRWLQETNFNLQLVEFSIGDVRYMPLLSTCHTLTKNVVFKKVQK